MATKTRMSLQAQTRTIHGNQNKALRRDGFVPGNIFGHGDSLAVQISEDIFARMLVKHQTAGLLDLVVDGKTETVVVRHIMHKPSSGRVQHVDFMRVRMNEVIHTRVPLHLVGESPAAKALGGSVMTLVETLEIEALPDNLPEFLTIDASILIDKDMIIHASDIKLPEGVKLLSNADEPIVKLQLLRSEPVETPETPAPAEPTPAAGA